MTRSVVVLGVVATLAAGRFMAQEARPATSVRVETSETALKEHVAKLQERTQRAEDRIDRLTEDTERLESTLKKSEAAVATLSRQVKTLAEAQERLARAISVEPSGAVRITGNLRLDNNVLEDTTVVNCDAEGISGARRQCTCPAGSIVTGIELRPLALSAYPGPATYNTALVCSRL
jgi:uncharacterized protein YoxC